MILSLAWTTEAFLQGKKTVTRRRWTDSYFQYWVTAWRRGQHIHEAYDKTPRSGGKRIGRIRLTCCPYRERLADMPESDLDAEGGLWANKEEFIEVFGGDPEERPVVIRFEAIPDPDALTTRRLL